MNLFIQKSRRRNSCTVTLLLLLDCLHYYLSLYICSIGRYYTENMLSFTLNIMLTDSLLLTNTTNRMLTILIANLLTLGIIRTVDIFICPLNRRLGGAKHEIGAKMLKQRNEKTFSEDISVEETCWTSKSSMITRSLTK